MDSLYQSITNSSIRNLIIVSFIMIFTDVITGYLKAIKNKEINSSISRDGYIKKVGWIISIVFGFVVDYILNISLFLKGTVFVIVATEGMSIYENLSDIGVKLPFSNYFEKVSKGGENNE